ncbi:hypothetical protein CDV52_09545 [Haematobacter missouriensis]|uniref:Uncharacterized protein n=1 Tax=Haematobacter missouriensis TaxID=366616 RepID=A0A212ARX3_9RHOB|nr:lipopolysaccharide biosynthesis protein [Haematobacter missouriensis]OWJ84116.1 hypothetical protein CDV52_09545 [Haematobacter missouriensis]
MTDMRSTALKGASWAVAARLTRAVVGILTLAILSRFLLPAEFGIAALVIFVTGLAQIFADFGTRMALVQRPEITPIEEDCVFWSNLVMSVIVAGGIYLFAGPLATLFGDPGVAEPLRWVSPYFIIVSMAIVSLSLLEREMSFGWIAVADMVSSIVGALVAISLVLLGFRISALILQQLAMAAVWSGILIHARRWRPRLRFSFRAFRPLLSYGSYMTGATAVEFLSGHVDRPIIGNQLSTTDLGYLTMGSQVVASPLRIVAQMVRKVMFPILSRVQNDDVRMREGILGVQYGLVLIMAPMCFGLWALADPIIDVLLGPDWQMVATLMGFMTLRVFFLLFNEVNTIVFSAKGQARFQFRWNIFALLANVAVILAAVPFGLVAVVAAQLGLCLVLVPVNTWFASRLVKMSAARRFTVALPPIMSAVLMAVVVHLVDQRLDWHPVARLLLGVPLGVILFGISEMIVDARRFRPILQQFFGRIQRFRNAN